MPADDWPKSAIFQKDGTQIAFASAAELKNWIGAERGGWASLIPQNSRTLPINQNHQLLDSLDSDTSDANWGRVAESYWPATGNFGRFASRIYNSGVRNNFILEMLAPGAAPPNLNHPDYFAGRTIAYFYAGIGQTFTSAERATELLPGLTNEISEVDRIRSSAEQWASRFQALLEKAEADWQNKIDGFEAKVALNAPKTYWKERSAQHNKRAEVNRRQWFWAMVVLILAIAVAFGLNFAFTPAPSLSSMIATDVQRFIAFGTLLAVAVWWLRQKLRDLRMHEHFAEDADERATMVETYAALRATGLQDANLEPVLMALYRPAISAFREDVGPSLPIDALVRALGNVATARAKES